MQRNFLGKAVPFFLFIALILASAQPAAAMDSLRCDLAWDGPSADNNIVTCLTSLKRLSSQVSDLIYPGVAVLLLLVTILSPIAFCCCKRCCCRCCPPADERAKAKGKCSLWTFGFCLVLWSCGACILIIYGSHVMMDSANKILDDTINGPLDYLKDTNQTIVDLLLNYSANPPSLPPGINLSGFDVDYTPDVERIRTDYFKYFKIAAIVSYCIGGFLIFLVVVSTIFVACRCAGACPTLMAILYWVSGLIFSILAVVFLVLMYAITTGCGEVTLQYQRQPGLFQWYLVPWCQKTFDFASLRSDLSKQESDLSQQACAQVLNYCDNDPTNTDVSKPFMCGMGISTPSDCQNFDKVQETLLTTYAKPMFTTAMCTNESGWEYLERCTPLECSTRCKDMTNPPFTAKTYALQMLDAAGRARNASAAMTYALPLLHCDYIIDKFAAAIEAPRPSSSGFFTTTEGDSCSALHSSSIMIGTGFFVSSICMLGSIYAIMRTSIYADTKKE